MNKKLNISVNCQNPFMKEMKYTNKMDNGTFYSEQVSCYRMRDIRLSVSYSFGTLKDSIRKVQRGISNDDNKSGGGGGEPSGM